MAEEGSGTPQLKWTGEYDDAGKAHGQVGHIETADIPIKGLCHHPQQLLQ